MHVLKRKQIMQVFTSKNFVVDYCEYHTRPGLPTVCLLDGRKNSCFRWSKTLAPSQM
jgi:hypothetical protein